MAVDSPIPQSTQGMAELDHPSFPQGQIPSQSQLSRGGSASAPSAVFLAQGLQSGWLKAQETPTVHLLLSVLASTELASLPMTSGSSWAIREWFSDS